MFVFNRLEFHTVDISVYFAIIYLTRQLERWLQPIRSGKIYNLVTKVVANLDQRQGGYFLFFIFRMDTIKLATAMIIINSSYVLIITTPSVRPPDRVEARPPSCLGKYIIFFNYSPAGAGE